MYRIGSSFESFLSFIITSASPSRAIALGFCTITGQKRCRVVRMDEEFSRRY